MTDQRLSERSIFEAAIEKGSPEERAAYLNQACGSSSGLRQGVEALLAAHERLGDISLSATVDEPAVTERSGTVIGPYKLLEQIGEGGFGVVFMAEQTEPVRRKVALKVLKPGMDTRHVVARFEAERQALALMDHPNIAKVLDGGQTSSGRPYFVMDLVKGLPITEYCDQAQLTTRERLQLFVGLCQAVQHAHQKGIIHRDLKPSNVLVTLHDDTSLVKVIDFGIAKALGQQLTDKTLFTGFAQMIGTPLYMSPEQAALSDVDVDTRSDIYALGVLLYELLTGTTPFDKERLRTVGYDEIRRIIREEEPVRPSTRISTLGPDAVTVSARRQSDPKKLGRVLRGELDWIVMKALEKDRDRRYETASGFAADVQRYLNDEPVLACPPSAWYRFRKLARRNRAAFAMAGLVFAALALTVAILAVSNIRIESEQRAKDEALRVARVNAGAAEAQRRRACQAVDDFYVTVSESALLNEPVFKPLRMQLLQGALKYYQDFSSERPDDPEMQAEVATSFFRMVQIRIAMRQDWIDPLQKGTAILQKLADRHVGAKQLGTLQRGVIRGSGNLGNIVGMPNPAKAYACFLTLQRILDRLVKENPTVRGFRSDLAGLSNLLGIMHASMGKPADAVRDHRRAYQSWEKLAQANPDMPDYRAEVVTSLSHLGSNLLRLNLRPEAEEALRKGIAVGEKLTTDFPAVPGYQVELAGSYSELVALLQSLGKGNEALEIGEKELSIRKRLVAARPTVPEYSSRLGTCSFHLAEMLRTMGRSREAKQLQERALAQYTKAIELDPKSASAHLALASACVRWGRWDQALAAFDKAAELEPGNHLHVCRAAALRLRAGDLAGYRRACRVMLERFADTDQPEVAEHTARTCLLAPDAVTDLDPVLKLADQAVKATHKSGNYPGFMFGKGLAEYRAGRHAEAVKWLERLTVKASSEPFEARVLAVMAMSQHRRGRGDQAEAALARAKAILAKMPDPAGGRWVGEDWLDWLHAQILYRAAEDLITKESGKRPN
jgi:serine/threonine protein kinase/Flp pilus assembly protein TadD